MPAAAVKPGDHSNFLSEGGNLKQSRLRREPFGKYGQPVALDIEVGPFVYPQLPDLLQVKIDGIKASIGSGAIGKALRYIRGAIEMDVVQHDGGPIPA